jgi:Helix-turn-helix domain
MRRDDDHQYSTGQAARMLHVSQGKVRRWCNEGLIDCSPTNGGHFRIAASAIERIQKHGEPELPRRSENMREPRRPRNRGALDGLPPDLYREPSDLLAESAESVRLAENRVRRRKLEFEGETIEDEFSQLHQRKAAEEREHQREIAEAKGKEDRQRWIQAKLDWTLKPMPSEPGWEAFDMACRLSGIPQRSAAGLPMNAPLEIRAAIAADALKLLQTDAARLLPEEMINEQIRAAVVTTLAKQQRHEQEKQNTTLKALAEIIGNRNAQNAQQAGRNLEMIAAAAKLLNGPEPAAAAEPTQSTSSPVLRPVEAPDEDEHDATEEAEHAAIERRVRNLLMDEAARYLRELDQEGPDLFGEGFAGKCDRWEAEGKFREAIHDDLLDIVLDHPEIPDDDIRVEIRNLMDDCWYDIMPDEEGDRQ